MFEIKRFKAEDVIPLIYEPMNAHLRNWYDDGTARKLENDTKAFTGRIDNEVMACGGVVDMWAGRGYLWFVLSEKIKDHSISVYRGAKKWLRELNYRRLEMDVPLDMELAHRRAIMLGFYCETPYARQYLPSGRDASIYVMVRN